MYTLSTTLNTSILIAAGLITVILLLFLVAVVMQHRRNIQLWKEKLDAEVRTLEHERVRIAADLHDDLGPLLATVKFQVSNLEVAKADEPQLIQADDRLEEILQRLREIAHDLMPTTLQRKGVYFALEELVDNLNGKIPTRITVHSIDTVAFENEKAVHLYRILQEIIHNTIKHAQAQKLDITLQSKNNMLLVETVDDGKGFQQTEVRTGRNGRGLLNLLNRCELMGGSLYLDSQPGKGTRYNIEIPV
ncbi:MAG: sensor histidine kinase [Bacteroidetes bacterium]|nr:sensor histidine kinase [Bacteroidota bacterium]